MTREYKLALIIGFILTLIVGVLVSDHFARTRAEQYLGDSQIEAKRLILEVEALELRLKAALTDGYEERIANAEISMNDLQTRLDYLLEATEEENVRTVLAALQRFSDMDRRQDRLENKLDAQYGLFIGLLITVIAGMVGIVASNLYAGRKPKGDPVPVVSTDLENEKQ